MTKFDYRELDLSDQDAELLERYRFDSQAFIDLQARLIHGRFSVEANRLHEPVAPLEENDLARLPPNGSADAIADEKAGRELMERGGLGIVVLNGGMATRFGGVVKGTLEVTDSMSFLGLRMADAARAPGPVHVFLMNSFATDADTRTHLERHKWFGLDRKRAAIVTQSISLRLTPSGEVFRDSSGRPSFYAPGHGDLFAALANSAEFRRFTAQGGRVVWVSNVDNVGATVDAAILGAHLRAKRPVTVEVAARARGDKGGAPARVRGHVEVVEGFRFPASFDIESIPVFNTNTMLVDVQAIRPDYPLTWFRADKVVDEQPVVQFERLMGEITAFEESNYLVVEREGPQGRFLPVKTKEDLVTLQPRIATRFANVLKKG